MARLHFLIFSVWFLALPFGFVSKTYLGVAIDKALGPILLLLWASAFSVGRYRLDIPRLLVIASAFGFFFVRNLSFIGNAAIYSSLMWEDAIHLGYFSLPVLFVKSLSNSRTGSQMVAINSVVGCLSAFLVALHVISLPYERFSESRIGIETVQKSIGLFSSYGDITQYTAYFLLLGLFMPSVLTRAKSLHSLVKWAAVIVLVMGLIGNQSRSFLLSVVLAYGMARLLAYRSKKGENSVVINGLFVIAGIVTVVLIGYLFSDIVNLLMGLGGKEAAGSAGARLIQYKTAFELIRQYPILGVDADYILANNSFGHGIHNMWLGQLTRGGIVGALALMLLMGMMFRSSLRLLRHENVRRYGTVSVGYMVAVLVSTLFYPADTDLFWAMLGMNISIVYVLQDAAKLSPGEVEIFNHYGPEGGGKVTWPPKPESRLLWKRPEKP